MGKRLTVMDKVRRAVEGASVPEIQDAYRDLRALAERKARVGFAPGMRVRARKGVGRRLPLGAEGVIKSVNPKTITVDFGEYRVWRMYPGGLEAVEAA